MKSIKFEESHKKKLYEMGTTLCKGWNVYIYLELQNADLIDVKKETVVNFPLLELCFLYLRYMGSYMSPLEYTGALQTIGIVIANQHEYTHPVDHLYDWFIKYVKES